MRRPKRITITLQVDDDAPVTCTFAEPECRVEWSNDTSPIPGRHGKVDGAMMMGRRLVIDVGEGTKKGEVGYPVPVEWPWTTEAPGEWVEAPDETP